MQNQLFVVCFFLLSFTAAATVPIAVTDMPSITIAPRVALVVGNTHYQNNPLRTSTTDASAVAGHLKARGFDVIQLENATLDSLEQALLDLNARLGETGIGLFYFAGHGLQTAKSLLVLPIDADTSSPDTVQRTALSVDSIATQMSLGRPGQPNLLIIDSCLNNPYRASDASTHSQVSHLPELPAETLIAFATAQGAVAFEGMEHQGIYVQALMNGLRKPGLDVSTILNDVRHTVRVRTRNQQVPWVLSSLDTPMILPPYASQAHVELATSHPRVLTLAQITSMPTRGILPQDGDAQYELEFWQSIKDSTDASDYEAYLEAYPDGKFAPLAKVRAQRYKKSTPQPARQPSYIISELDDQYEVVRNANIRQTPSSKSRRLGELKRGSSVHVTGQLEDKKWYQVRSAGMTGYVFAELLRKPVAKPAPAAKPKPAPAPERKPVPVAKPAPLPAQQRKVEEIKDCPSCPVMLSLPAGNFTMGASQGDRSEKPAHRVSIKKPFAIGKYEVTVAQWNACHKAGACSYRPDIETVDENSPVRDISWSDAREYVRWLSTVTNKSYRLPTEAEWEYAARGGTDTTFWWGNRVGVGQANCKNCGGNWDKKSPANVDAFPANPFGLHGTSGGVWEWVADCWHKTYQGAPKDGAVWGRHDCRENVIRGGAWRNDASYIHSASRFKYDTHVRYLLNGFRVARTLP